MQLSVSSFQIRHHVAHCLWDGDLSAVWADALKARCPFRRAAIATAQGINGQRLRTEIRPREGDSQFFQMHLRGLRGGHG